MKITVRLIVSLLIVVALVTFGFSLNQVNREKGLLVTDLQRRALMLAESIQESLPPLIKSESKSRLSRLANKFGNRERLKGIVIYDNRAAIITSTNGLTQEAKQFSSRVVHTITNENSTGHFYRVDGQNTYVFAIPISEENSETIGTLVMLYDGSFIDQQLGEIWKQNLMRFMVLSIMSVISTVLVVRWSITGPIARLSNWMREIRTARPDTMYQGPLKEDVLSSLVSEATQMAKSLALARTHAEEEARLRMQSESLWTPERLKEFMKTELRSKKLFVVSNREPYSHIKEGLSVRCVVPPGGLVTALDPVMRICDGVWIAHGNTDADRDTVDAQDKVRVPPEEPAYTLKRLWLTREQENGYYYGFSNEGLWPLCHITHTRPEFRQTDWVYYQQVNELFAEALLREIDSEEAPLILVQDYHLALLPALIKKRRSDSKVALFWHIPWSSPESFGICPWRNEILTGMLAADLIGFHIQSFCNNFLDTVDKFLESKIDWEEFSVLRGEHSALIKPFPISVAFEDADGDSNSSQERKEIRDIILRENDIETEYIGVGVDRIDYTKGIPERFHAIERFFEKYPQFLERLTFFELAAPSRDHLKKYRQLITEMEEIVDRVNWRFRTKKWKPVVYLKANHSHVDIRRYYKAADICMVTSLHDGMNLVAKEFIAARPDYDAVLILSQFTGASRELKDAITVNPYDVEEMAEAIKSALTISPFERRERMARMYSFVKEHNIYSWAGKLIGELTRMR